MAGAVPPTALFAGARLIDLDFSELLTPPGGDGSDGGSDGGSDEGGSDGSASGAGSAPLSRAEREELAASLVQDRGFHRGADGCARVARTVASLAADGEAQTLPNLSPCLYPQQTPGVNAC